jgi:hypothetical protein
MHRARIGTERNRALAKNCEQIAQACSAGEVKRIDAIELMNYLLSEFDPIGTADQHLKQRLCVFLWMSERSNYGCGRLRKINAARPRGAENHAKQWTAHAGDKCRCTFGILVLWLI